MLDIQMLNLKHLRDDLDQNNKGTDIEDNEDMIKVMIEQQQEGNRKSLKEQFLRELEEETLQRQQNEANDPNGQEEAKKKKKKRKNKKKKKQQKEGETASSNMDSSPSKVLESAAEGEREEASEGEDDDEDFEMNLKMFEQRLKDQQRMGSRENKLKPNISEDWLKKIREEGRGSSQSLNQEMEH